MRASKEFLAVYDYCARGLRDVYELDILHYSYELYMAYLNAKRTYDPTRVPRVCFQKWVFMYLRGAIKDGRISESKKNRGNPKSITYYDSCESSVELRDLLNKYDANLLYDTFVIGHTLSHLSKQQGSSLSTIHQLRNKLFRKVRMNVDLSEYYDAIVSHRAPLDYLLKTSGRLLEQITDSKYKDNDLFLLDLKRAMFYASSALKFYHMPLDILSHKTKDITEDVHILVCNAIKIADKDNNKSTHKSLHTIIGCIDSITKRMGMSLQELCGIRFYKNNKGNIFR